MSVSSSLIYRRFLICFPDVRSLPCTQAALWPHLFDPWT
jgi:hypothetical protein